MPMIGLIAGWVVLLAAAAGGLYWLVVFYRVIATAAQLPTARAGLALADGDEREAAARPVLVIMPAHNEAATIAQLVGSLKSQDHPAMRVVLALDRCTDRTATIAREAVGGDARFEIIEIQACPEGWAGKVHAIHRALDSAGALGSTAGGPELLLFTDADCQLEPGAVRAAAALLADRGLHLLSLLTRLRSRRWYELVVQPSAIFELVRQYPLLRVNRGGERQRAFANGQFLLFDAEAYRRIGGHEAVRDELLEDIALARLIKREGLRGGLLSAGGLVRCAMYDTWSGFVRGWKRIYTEAASRRSGRLRGSAMRVLLGVTLAPLAAVAAIVLGVLIAGPLGGALVATGVTAATAAVAAALTIAWLSGSPAWALPAAPIGGAMVAWILARAAADLRGGRPTEWAGRSYHRRDRSAAGHAAEEHAA